MSISPALRTAYTTARQFDASGEPRRFASEAFAEARRVIAAGRTPYASRPRYLGHGDVIRSRTATGERRTYVVAIMPDSDMGAPWDEHDGHGEIAEVGRYHTKAPGEVLISGNHSGATVFAYDIAATTQTARRDGWGLRPDHAAALERRLGRAPTARQRTAEAVRLDMERCRDWLCDRWSWIGVALIEMPRGPHSPMPSHVADSWAEGRAPSGTYRAGLWGIESDSPDYHHAVALELVSEANA